MFFSKNTYFSCTYSDPHPDCGGSPAPEQRQPYPRSAADYL